MTIDPRQFEQQLLGAINRKRSLPAQVRLKRLAWGMGVTAITVGMGQFLAPLLGFRGADLLGVIAFSSVADLAAFTLGILYLAIAVAERATLLEVILMAVGGYCYLRPDDYMGSAILGVVNFAMYLIQRHPKAAPIFACCFAVANLMRLI